MLLLLVQMALIRSLPNTLNNMIRHLLDLVTASDDRNKKQESAVRLRAILLTVQRYNCMSVAIDLEPVACYGKTKPVQLVRFC